MPAIFLQQCDHVLGNATRDVSLYEAVVEHIRQNRQKHVRQPQVHLSRRLVEADLLQRITDFAFSNHTCATSRFSRPETGKVGKIAAKHLMWEIRIAGKALTKVHPKGITHLAIRSQHVPIQGLDGIDILIGKSSHFFLTRCCVRFHSFVENSFKPRSNNKSLVVLASLTLKVSPILLYG